MTESILPYTCIAVLISCANSFRVFTYERILCEHSSVDISCQDYSLINEVNVSTVDIKNVCFESNISDGNVHLNTESYSSCIGKNSCTLTSLMIDMSHLVIDRTRKLVIEYNCVREKEEHRILSFTEELCPFDTDSITCRGKYRKVDIQSVTSKTNISFCQETDLLKVCMEKIQHTVKTVCNGKQGCLPVILNTSSSLWRNCERIPNVFNVSFSCIEQPTKTSQKEEKVEQVIGCVIGGVVLMTIVLVAFLLIRRKRNEESNHKENEQQSDTMYSNSNEYNNLSFTRTSSAYTEIIHPVNLEHYYNEVFWKNTFLSCSEQDDPNDYINYGSCSK